MKYRVKTDKIDARQLTEGNADSIIKWIKSNGADARAEDEGIAIVVNDSAEHAHADDWILQIAKGEFRVLGSEAFEAAYEPAST